MLELRRIERRAGVFSPAGEYGLKGYSRPNIKKKEGGKTDSKYFTSVLSVTDVRVKPGLGPEDEEKIWVESGEKGRNLYCARGRFRRSKNERNHEKKNGSVEDARRKPQPEVKERKKIQHTGR